MKLYKFILRSRYVYAIAETILEAKEWMDKYHKGAKFVSIEKVTKF